MSKLAKFKGGIKRAGKRVTDLASGEKVGAVGHDIITLGSHAGLALASKNMTSIGPVPVKPDVAGVAAGLAVMTFAKKDKTRKLGKSVAMGAAHACITRWIADDGFSLIQGPDGRLHRSDESAEAAE